MSCMFVYGMASLSNCLPAASNCSVVGHVHVVYVCACSALPHLVSHLVSHHSGQVAPRGMTNVQPMMCGTCANENAIKRAFIGYMVSIGEVSKDRKGQCYWP